MKFSNTEKEMDVDAFSLPNGERLVGIWLSGEPADETSQVITNISFPNQTISRIVGIDVLNGTQQELQISGNRLQAIVVKDYPIFLRIQGSKPA
jgi:hypothetical protein